MSIFNKILTLSKQIATSLIKNEHPTSLDKSDLFNEEDKKHILKNLTNESIIRERQDLKNKINVQVDWQKVKPKKVITVRKLVWQYAAAAVVVGIISTTFFFKDNIFDNNEIPANINSTSIVAGTDKATLTLDDGVLVALTKGTKYQTSDAQSNGEEIVYTATNNQQPIKTNYNTLTIPRGGQFQIKLSDGTKVWLNSESQLKYPVSFSKGESRKVELVYGEAYFDVSPSTKHNGSKFKVRSRRQEIEVLGTEFNIKAYQDETTTYTTLVEGKIGVKNAINEEVLSPNQQSIINTNTNKIVINSVNVSTEISWIHGKFIFNRKPLKDIMKVLSRWYDMDVVFTQKQTEDQLFTGTLSKEQNIEDILLLIKNTNFINTFEINNKTIILN
jgi:ferric-dicitrate binding protein FerR (iron transport regulator)